jgi:hypothetical protein
MLLFQQSIDRLALCVQPLVFETGVEGARYSSTRGTVFLVGYEGRSYVLTARHALQPNNIMPICVFPSDTSHQLIPLKDMFYVPSSHEGDDFEDYVVIEVNTRRITHPDVAGARLINLGISCGEWKEYAHEAQFFVLGYPEERSFLNYETTDFQADRVILLGRYSRPSILQFHHVCQSWILYHLKRSVGLVERRFSLGLSCRSSGQHRFSVEWCYEGRLNQV